MSTHSEWKGVPISHIQGSNSPWGAPEFPLIQPAYNHTVLYHIPSNGATLDRPPKPQIGRDKWDDDHVRLPCSPHSLYPVENSSGSKNIVNRWEMIQRALNRPMRNSKELADAILSYNTQYKTRWKFAALHGLFNGYLEEEESKYFFDVTLPEIAKLALALPKLIQSPIPLLKQDKDRSISMSQQQISCLLANAFFCTFPRRNTMKKNSEYSTYPHINFNVLFNCSPADHVMEKLKCICHYFKRVCTKVPVGVMTLRRRVARTTPQWAQARQPISALPLHIDPRGTIEDAEGLIQVDFANKYLGGGVLNYGCVQEEIRFMICPELLISLLVTEELKPNEALIMIGSERYSNYTGYSSTFSWADVHADATPHDSSGRRRTAVLAVDALPYRSRAHECTPHHVTRELNKAWTGFSMYGNETPGEEACDVTLEYPGVATGNWGCGAFGGSAEIKWLVQAIAAIRAGRALAYFTFGDTKLRDDIAKVYALLSSDHVTVGELYGYLLKYCKTDVCKISFNAFLEQTLKEQPPASCAETVEVMDYTMEDAKEDSLAFLKHLEESPDMFTDDDEPTTVSETDGCSKVPENKIVDITDDSDENKTSSLERNKMAPINKIAPSTSDKSDNNMASSSGSTTFIKILEKETKDTKTSNTSKLFEEMGKLDEESGKLNLNSPKKLFFKNKSESENVEDKVHFEVTSEVKKKMSKKITDYFSKKPT
ncbi:poly(ADP-ribose) glycohydrolase-like [Aricia agestis]|uniref:poly(ADP-ribose) glycohydrolase-like n=1 Tax=Aricia agestis TaxID=91739 RepID=UPI001C209462|nr:poly(ADP-ribose) glycohydrolase-like [Aricia agestis]